MKIMRSAVVSLAMILLSAPVIHGQDLSKYRNFSFGMSLADLSKQVGDKPANVNVLHRRPAVIQELKWWPPRPSGTSLREEPVQEILLSFYNGELYRILVTYDHSATEGLTAEDVVQALSTEYGIATRPHSQISFPNDMYRSTEKVIARWEDSRYSLNLFRSSLSNTFGFVMFRKRLEAQAAKSVAEAVELERQEAPQREVARQIKEADDLEVARQKNKKIFHP